MLNTLIELLKASEATAWEITDTVTRAWEFYYIRHRLDQHRVRDVEHIQVRVFRSFEDGRFLGSASGEIHPSATREEARAQIAQLCENAVWIRNPAYTLNRPDHRPVPAPQHTDIAATARAFMEVMTSLPETETEDINSYEIFTEENDCRFLNSEGIDVRSISPASMMEVVVNARDGKHEIEMYHAFRSGTCDREALRQALSAALRQAKDRLSAASTPALEKYDVLLSTEDAAELYAWYAARMSAPMKYQGISDAEIGKELLPGTEGDRITLRGLRELPNSSRNALYDKEGAPVQELTLIDRGVAGAFHGSRQFREYIGLPDGCIVSNFEVSGGTRSEATLRSGNYLEVVAFSDFSVDAINGSVAGEIRLGYWHHDGRISPVTGGSVSGNMNELARRLTFSREQRQYNSWLIPAVTRIAGATITGAE